MRRLCAGPASTSTSRAGEVVRRGGGDLAPDVGPGGDRPGRGEVDELVLPGAAGEHRRVALARPLDEELLDAPDAGPVLGQRAALDDDLQAGEALGDDGRIDEPVGHRRRLGARARRELERVRRVELGGGGDLEGGDEVGLGLAGEADDDVGGDRQVGDRPAGPRPSRSR